MWERAKRAMVESAREVYGSVTVGGKNPKNCSRKESTLKGVLAARDEEAKERCMEA